MRSRNDVPPYRAASPPVRHPQSDLRPWLRKHAGRVSAYTAGRIEQSYPFVADLLGRCPDFNTESAWDVGCGAGFDSFALGTFFDRVLAVDRGKRAVAEAKRMAREAGVHHVSFQARDVERMTPPERYGFVFCNLMSHSLPSRSGHVRRLATALQPEGFLFYSEIAEGYAPRDIHRALRHRDVRELVLRLHQVINGFAAEAGFRFFPSGTLRPLFDRAGLTVQELRVDRWNGLALSEAAICQSSGISPQGTAEEGEDTDLAAIRQTFLRWSRSGRDGLGGAGREALIRAAERGESRYAPFLFLLVMADLVLTSLKLPKSTASRRDRLHTAVRLRLGGPSERLLDWPQLEKLDLKFLEEFRRRAGLQGAPIED